MQDEILEKVEKLLALEVGMYETLRKMVGRQFEAILLNGDMEELLNLLEEKQEVISRLQLLADSWGDLLATLGIEDARGSEGFWNKLADHFPKDKAVSFHATLTQAREAAEDLMNAEERLQGELEKHVQKLRDKMLGLKKGRTAFIGYTKMGGAHIVTDSTN